jgi:3,4-dihydroxy 2-butanone 4-phosphate synthase/GTP cyclohydrolase II
VTTGISAYDRSHTVRAAVARDARPDDLRQPGHIFPLMAQPGGVLTRAGHTEAGCDLARLAGFEPASVIVEILNEDGTMARRPDLQRFAEEHRLKIGTIADLIRYRLHKERSVERVSDQVVETEFGPFRMCWYEDHVHRTVHVALIRGELDASVPPLVRVHLLETLRDVIGVGAIPGWTLRGAMERIAAEPSGVVIILRQEERPREIIEIVQALGGGGEPPVLAKPGGTVLRTYGIGAQILQDLGVSRMRVLSAPKQMTGISAFGLEVTEYVD